MTAVILDISEMWADIERMGLTDTQVGFCVQLLSAIQSNGPVSPDHPCATNQNGNPLVDEAFAKCFERRGDAIEAKIAWMHDLNGKSAAPEAVEAPRPKPADASAVAIGFPINDVGRVLTAAGVKQSRMTPLYWYRTDHQSDLRALQDELGLSTDEIIGLLKGIPKRPDLRRILDLTQALKEHRANG